MSKKAPEESNSESEEREIQVVQDIQRKGKKTIDNIKSKPRKLGSPDKTLSNSLSTIPTSPLSSVCPMLPWLQDASDDSNDQWPALPPEVIKDDENSNDFPNHSFLDPQTGEVVDIEDN